MLKGNEKIKLQYPIKVGSDYIDEVSLRRPTVKELALLDKYSGIEASVVMISKLTGLEELVLEAMDAADFIAVNAVAEGFLPNTLKTGAI